MAKTVVSNTQVLSQPIRGVLLALLVYCTVLALNIDMVTWQMQRPLPKNIRFLRKIQPGTHSTLRGDGSPLKDDLLPAQYRSNFYNLTMTPNGPILRVRHMVNATSKNSQSQAVGSGLHVAKTGVPATVSILVNMTAWVSNIRDIAYSVLAVGEHDMFSAILVGAKPQEELNFTYSPKLPGTYDLYVEEIHGDTQFQIPGSPFHLSVEGPSVSATVVRNEADQLPSCQSLDLKNPRWEDGCWVTRHYAGEQRGTLRSGWVYQRESCSFDIFSKDDLALVTESSDPKRVLVLGTSVNRGIFLSIVDLLLTSEEKEFLNVSDVGKCWGYMDVQVGNFRVSYQDFRLVRARSSLEEKDGIECHDEKLAQSTGVPLLHAIQFLQNVFSEESNSWPDVITLVPKDQVQFQLIMNAIPESWNGTIFPLYNFFAKENIYTPQKIHENYVKAISFLSVDPRVQLVDGFSMAAGMRHAREASPFVRRSSHFHKFCNELNGEMRVCGDTTEMMAQLLLGKLIAPKGKRVWKETLHRKKRSAVRVKRKVKVCHDCPKSLLPFHIKIRPQPKCYMTEQGLKPSNEVKTVWDGTLCPEECMNTEPVEEIPTQSGFVKVRKC